MADNNTPITIADGSQIQFKHGTQSKLDEIRSKKSGKSGTFYLTNDTHRLYVGLSDNSIVPVNEGITTYATVSNLPEPSAMNAGQFAYITASGILAVSNGKNWVQINANTDTLYTYSGFTEDNGSNGVSITTKLINQKNNEDYVSYTFSLTGENGIKIIETGDDGGITIYGTKLSYTVDVNNNKAAFKLIDKDGNPVDDGVTIKGGNNVTITETEIENKKKAIQISATDTTLDGLLTHGGPTNKDDDGEEHKTGFKIFATDTAKAISGGYIDPIIRYGDPKEPLESVKFPNGIATLDVYTREQVDNLRAEFDAMEYKGVVDGLPPISTGVQNGWTYKAGSSFIIYEENSATGEEITVYPGDLIIAQDAEPKVEGEQVTTIKWGYVPSGNEDTTYKVKPIDHGIEIDEYPTKTASAGSIGSIQVFDDKNKIEVLQNRDESDNSVQLTVKHKLTERNDPGRENTFINRSDAKYIIKNEKIITIDASPKEGEDTKNGIRTDSTGHVEKVYTQNATIYDTNAILSDMLATISGTTNKDIATVKLQTTLERANGDINAPSTSFYIQSLNKNLEMNVEGTSVVQMDLIWDTF